MESYNGNSKVNKDEFLAGIRDQGVALQKIHQEVNLKIDIDACRILQ